MKYIKTFLENKTLNYKFEKVTDKTMLKPSFGAKKGTTDFYQIKLDDKPLSEIEVNPNGYNGKPEIMSAFSDIKSQGLGKLMVEKILDIYLKDEVYVKVTKDSRSFWEKMGAKKVEDDMYKFTK